MMMAGAVPLSATTTRARRFKRTHSSGDRSACVVRLCMLQRLAMSMAGLAGTVLRSAPGSATSGHGTVTSVRRLPWSWRHPSTTVLSVRCPRVVEGPSEGEVYDAHAAPRRQNTPHPGTRPGRLAERRGRSGVTAPCGTPHFELLLWRRRRSRLRRTMPSTAQMVSFLLHMALKNKKEERSRRRWWKRSLRFTRPPPTTRAHSSTAAQAGTSTAALVRPQTYIAASSAKEKGEEEKKQEEEEEEEEAEDEEDTLAPAWVPALLTSLTILFILMGGFHCPLYLAVTHLTLQLWPRSSSTPAVAYAGLVWLVTPRAVFLVVVCRPEMLCIMADLEPEGQYCSVFWQWHVQGWFCW